LVTGVATLVPLVVPCWVTVVSVHKFSTDPSHFSRCLRGLHVAEIGKELNCPFQPFGDYRIFRTAMFEFNDIQNLLSRGEQPAKRVGERERYRLAWTVVQLLAIRIGNHLQMIQRPQPKPHSGSESAGAGSRTPCRMDPHFRNPVAELRQEDFVRHSDREIATLNGFRSL